MTSTTASNPSTATCLVFGIFGGQWAWRLEWRDARGRFHTKDFAQVDLRPGVALLEAKAFRATLESSIAA